ncbi:nitrate reductase molybdenum cofactor assembly chaperone [Tistrella sp. BH-R2-4]|uniref:Nitrate reductase molybdenum cofactor assembly chaperone n=1 Tax=Tistrella arctica TaxID=3133430 RepID=A0ABU9YKR5_9PROT
MSRLIRIVSLLLSYPTAELQAAAPELRAAIAAETTLATETTLAPDLARDLGRLVDHIAGQDLYDAQEAYVLLFDRTRVLSLHLFEHVHGESRDRGQAMVDLKDMYEAAGFVIAARELPDHLPLFLEYLSTRAPDEAAGLLDQIAHITQALHARLVARDNPYAAALAVLVALAAASPAHTAPDPAVVAGLMAMPDDDPTDLEALDRIWEEEAVMFGAAGAGTDSCGPDRLRRQLRAASRPAPASAPAPTMPSRETV